MPLSSPICTQHFELSQNLGAEGDDGVGGDRVGACTGRGDGLGVGLLVGRFVGPGEWELEQYANMHEVTHT